MSSNRREYQSEFLTDFFTDDEDAKTGFRSVAKSGFVRCILLFGSAILALALVIVPVLSEKANKQTAQSLFPAGVDMISTGSVQQDHTEKSYIERKSLLQSSPQSVCVIANDGTQQGDC